MTSDNNTAPVNDLPLFYRKPTLLRYEEHKDLALKRSDNMRFAAKANAVPLLAGEFAAAQRSFPIVFTKSEVPVPVAILGIANEANLFVDNLGTWRKGAYLPAYLRRYPFISLETDNGQQLLCADLSSDRIVKVGKPGAEALFTDDGQATASTADIIQLCQAMNDEHAQTLKFAAAVAEQGLLVDKHADIRLIDDTRLTLDGFQLVDIAAFRALPADILAQWNANGWLELVVLHLTSQQNWQSLMELQSSRKPRSAA